MPKISIDLTEAQGTPAERIAAFAASIGHPLTPAQIRAIEQTMVYECTACTHRIAAAGETDALVSQMRAHAIGHHPELVNSHTEGWRAQ